MRWAAATLRRRSVFATSPQTRCCASLCWVSRRPTCWSGGTTRAHSRRASGHSGTALLRRDADALDDAAPFLGILAHALAELLRRGRRDLDRDVGHALLHVWNEQRAGDFAVEL